MHRLLALLILLTLLILPRPASAHHSMAGGAECGTYEYHAEQDLTKGRTDGIIYSVDHRVGCKRLILSNLSPAGRGEVQGNEGQMARCIRYGKEDAVMTYRYYFDTEIDPDDVKVTCSKWTGSD